VLDNYSIEDCTAEFYRQEEMYYPIYFISVDGKDRVELKKQYNIVETDNNSLDCIVQSPALSSAASKEVFNN
jgi:hypothetical protein